MGDPERRPGRSLLATAELNFLAEALPGDEVAVISEDRSDGERCRVRRVSDDKELDRARFKWRGSR